MGVGWGRRTVRILRSPLSRSGSLLIETLLALTLGIVVLGTFIGAVVSTMRWSRTLSGRSEALEVVRTVWGVLDEELRPGVVGRDWNSVTGQSIRLRAFRGVGRICASGGSGAEWLIAYRGRRNPDPVRDSILVLGEDGGWRVFPLLSSVRSAGCPTSEEEVAFRWEWATNGGSPRPILVRLFESGEYHLADGALRYRRGSAPRQPLTPERLGEASGFRETSKGMEVRLEFPGHPAAGDLPPFVWSVIGRGGRDG
jgi:hypothetical protein